MNSKDLRQILGKSQVNLRQIFGKSQAISCISCANLKSPIYLPYINISYNRLCHNLTYFAAYIVPIPHSFWSNSQISIIKNIYLIRIFPKYHLLKYQTLQISFLMHLGTTLVLASKTENFVLSKVHILNSGLFGFQC